MAAKKSTAAPAAEHHAFKAEMQQLLHIIIHSLYSEREIFLRELISNASDALNKLRFQMQTNSAVRDPELPLEISLELAQKPVSLTVSDNGVGMTHDELLNNLGTIARSGTLEFVKQLSSAAPDQRMEMIGQFGVGFYSVFMVASEVTVDTCPADPAQPAWRWSSDGSGEFSMAPSARKRRGTSIRLTLKPDQEEFAMAPRVEAIVKRYSNFIPQPIRLEGRQLNAQEAIWTRPREQVKPEEYHEFYKYVS
ncbi:MAG: ATP-binding protein, partial [Candidatus Lambdaproteobacteria bacterium]|nr:ATP-binding protein [Candidatus Lambdaproteobacteria bacterium]